MNSKTSKLLRRWSAARRMPYRLTKRAWNKHNRIERTADRKLIKEALE
jgi:hypothetical protein